MFTHKLGNRINTRIWAPQLRRLLITDYSNTDPWRPTITAIPTTVTTVDYTNTDLFLHPAEVVDELGAVLGNQQRQVVEALLTHVRLLRHRRVDGQLGVEVNQEVAHALKRKKSGALDRHIRRHR